MNKEIYREHSIISKSVNRLATQGWLEIKLDDKDRRRTRIFPAERATSHYKTIKQILTDTNEWMNQDLTTDEAQRLEELLQKAVNSVIPKLEE